MGACSLRKLGTEQRVTTSLANPSDSVDVSHMASTSAHVCLAGENVAPAERHGYARAEAAREVLTRGSASQTWPTRAYCLPTSAKHVQQHVQN